jgi:hypothetical protein
MQVPHPTFFLHNGFFRIARKPETVTNLETPDTERHVLAAF